MRHTGHAFIPVLSLILLQACSWESAQRTSYETVESMRIQQCMDQLDQNCSEERIRYDDYQSKRERLLEQER